MSEQPEKPKQRIPKIAFVAVSAIIASIALSHLSPPDWILVSGLALMSFGFYFVEPRFKRNLRTLAAILLAIGTVVVVVAVVFV